MRRIGVTIALAMLLAAQPLVPSVAEPAPRPLVVPGFAIGDWNLDVALKDFRFQLGPPQVRMSGTDIVFRRELVETSWEGPTVIVVHPPISDVVWAIGTSDRGARTVEGIGNGSSEQQVTAAYGVPPTVLELALRSKSLIYGDRGVAFEMPYVPTTQRYGAVGRVFVFRPGQAVAIWRLP